MSDPVSISVDVVSDVVCPWCFLGERRLREAIAAAGIDVNVRWRPYQLDPSIPPQGLERKAYMQAKFGDDERLKQVHANLVSLGAVDGISFDFEAIKVAPNTLDAHRVIRWAGTAGEDVQNRLVDNLFSRYFEQGGNTGDPAVLIAAARDAGMDAAVVETLLPTDADKDEVLAEIATASRMGITGVPCFLLEGRYAVMGAQETSVLADAIRQVSAAKARGELQGAG
ncbi:DsbA family protein [Mesorhizobium sp. SP-1A]|uniref:DsbA family oxidoreductase n=1 Tax=Mesorhizobium sp. SP-1A TaxID=3077840 RepID=UPI0028F6C25F|nr:DsbA family protein [Mesorhizobium sp. SP-1A]